MSTTQSVSGIDLSVRTIDRGISPSLSEIANVKERQRKKAIPPRNGFIRHGQHRSKTDSFRSLRESPISGTTEPIVSIVFPDIDRRHRLEMARPNKGSASGSRSSDLQDLDKVRCLNGSSRRFSLRGFSPARKVPSRPEITTVIFFSDGILVVSENFGRLNAHFTSKKFFFFMKKTHEAKDVC